MPIIIAAIVGVGSFMGYTLNEADKNLDQLHHLQYVAAQPAPESPYVLDLQCRDENPLQNWKPKGQ